MAKEIWKDIPEYEGFYQASNLGRIKSLSRERRIRKGCYFSKERILSPGKYTSGYLFVQLSKKGIIKTASIHQLVSMAFLGHTRCGFKNVINHKNFIKTDNRLDNLEIVTARENANMKHLPSTSTYQGVSWNKKHKKWNAFIFYKKIIYLGTFESESEASEYYQNALNAIKEGTEIVVKRKEYSSKYKNIYWDKQHKKWRAVLYINKKRINLGRFLNEEDAINACLEYKKNQQV